MKKKQGEGVKNMIETLGNDWPPQFELMKLQARKPDGGNWIDIFPAQLGWMAKEGYDVRAIVWQEQEPEK